MMIPSKGPQGPKMSRRRHFIEFKLVFKNSIKGDDDDDKSELTLMFYIMAAMCAEKRDNMMVLS